MWLIIIRLTYVLITLLLLTQVLIPLITDKPIFGLFRKSKPSKPTEKLSFDEELERAARIAEDAKKQKAASDADIDDKIKKVTNLNKHK